jgi:hypothetical protein
LWASSEASSRSQENRLANVSRGSDPEILRHPYQIGDRIGFHLLD